MANEFLNMINPQQYLAGLISRGAASSAYITEYQCIPRAGFRPFTRSEIQRRSWWHLLRLLFTPLIALIAGGSHYFFLLLTNGDKWGYFAIVNSIVIIVNSIVIMSTVISFCTVAISSTTVSIIHIPIIKERLTKAEFINVGNDTL